MKKILILALAALVLSSCSLFKITLSTGETAMTPAQVNMRMTTRGFYDYFVSTVVTAADSIVGASTKTEFKINAVRWKLDASTAATASCFQTVPEVGLLNTWVLCRQMNVMMRDTPDAKLFGAQSPVARAASAEVLAKIESLAKSSLPADRYALMSSFVDRYAATHPDKNLNVRPDNLMLEWIEYLGEGGKNYAPTVGSASQVLSDIGDRVSSYSTQFGNGVSWNKELIVMQMQQDSVRSRLAMQLDSTARDFKRMVDVLEGSPQMVDSISVNLTRQLGALIVAMNGSVDNAFRNIELQRMALQEFFAEQREQLMKETQAAADSAVKNAMDALPAVIGKLLLYVVIAGIAIFALPFGLGMWLGALRERRKKHHDKG